MCNKYTNTQIPALWIAPTKNKQEITKGRLTEQEKLGEAGGVGATFLVVLVLFWYLHQAQICSLAEKRASG